jgi:ABC-type amino acid transport substrate-binding protein
MQMKRRSLAFVAVIGALMAGVIVTACGSSSDSGSGNTLLVGSDIPYPPFEQGKAPDYDGFDIELVNEIAERTGKTVKYQDTAFDTIFRDVAQGKFDMVASAATITPEREQTVDFSDPYYEANQAIVVASGSDIQSVEDLDGKIIGAQDGTTGEAYANDEISADSVRGYAQGPEAIQAAKAGQVDAVIIDEPVAQDALSNQSGIEIAAVISTGELYGFAFAQDNDSLREEINKALQEIKDDGTLQKIYGKWFPGVEVPESVLSGTNESLK